MKKKLKNYQAEKKVAILKLHLVDGESVSQNVYHLNLSLLNFIVGKNSFLRMVICPS